MTEKLLQFIWQRQYYNRQNLATTDGEPVQVLHPGQWNTHQGPDFLGGRVRIGATEWAGHIELHLRSSDWRRHGHHHDPQYGKIILHVVWQHDETVKDDNGQPIPTLELSQRISRTMLCQYDSWMANAAQIPCGSGIAQPSALVWQSWIDRLLAERLLDKCSRVSSQLVQTGQHWEEICWRMIARAMGGPVNAESFQQIAESLPAKLLARHKAVVPQLEALLMGQAGLLHAGLKEDYARMLYAEYQFLQKKYGLKVVNQPPRFLRMRPVNFPTIRLAQLAMLLHQGRHLLGQWVDAKDLDSVRQLFDVTANDFWHYHYKLDDEESNFHPKKLGTQTINLLIINAVIPILFSYGHRQMQEQVRAKALAWMEQLPAEDNQITRLYAQMGRKAANAAHAQSMLHLKKEYCNAKRCLECAIGNQLLKGIALA